MTGLIGTVWDMAAKGVPEIYLRVGVTAVASVDIADAQSRQVSIQFSAQRRSQGTTK